MLIEAARGSSQAWRVHSAIVYGLVLALALSHDAAADDCPAFPLVRYEVPFAAFNPACEAATWSSPPVDVAFGGEIRQRYEYTHNPDFGATPQYDHGAWLQRWDGFVDAHWGEHVRIFAELQSALVQWRKYDPSPVDRNELEWQNAFLELREPLADGAQVWLRGGHQELVLGSQRLVSVRDGPNSRRTFDGFRASFETGRWRIDALAVRPRVIEPYAFDDTDDENKKLGGLYATRETGMTNVDIYWLYYSNEAATFQQGTGRERRNTVGVRLFGARGGWDWNWEPMVQWGQFGDADLRAWTIASSTGYTWETAALRPRVAVSANVASGDNNPNNPDLQTFNPLFPRGNYFSEASILGPQNFYNAHVFVTINPSAIWALTADYNAFWRLSKKDGVYEPSGQLLRASSGSDARFVATELSLTSEWQIGRAWTFTAIYANFSPRDFLADTGPSENVGYVELTGRYQF